LYPRIWRHDNTYLYRFEDYRTWLTFLFTYSWRDYIWVAGLEF